jgi:hypothetical protein
MAFVDPLVTPADAFRLFFCAHYLRCPTAAPQKFADTINSYEALHRRGVPRCVANAADVAIKRLCQHVKDRRIGLRGELDGRPPDFIDT